MATSARLVTGTAAQEAKSGGLRALGRAPALAARVIPLPDATGLWHHFSGNDLFGVAQSQSWVRAWAAHVNSDIIVGVLECDGAPVLVMPLEIVKDRGIVTARCVGGSHANANFPLLKRDAAALVTPQAISGVCAAIRLARPDIDALALSRQLQELEGVANPFLALTSFESPNLALSFLITEDFENLIKHRSGARKLKKMRQQARRMDERGGWQCVTAADDKEVEACLDAFFVMKSRRFEEFGLKDTFAGAGIKSFFKALYREGLNQSAPAFRLDALKVNNEIFAVAGSSLRHNSNIVEFGAVRAHEPTLSPGDFLFHQMIMHASETGVSSFDFGVGDEAYKRSWCDTETRHFESLRGFTLKGRLYALAHRLASAAKRKIKRSDLLSGKIRRLRMRGTAKPAAAEEH